jgi:hypothetical protein
MRVKLRRSAGSWSEARGGHAISNIELREDGNDLPDLREMSLCHQLSPDLEHEVSYMVCWGRNDISLLLFYPQDLAQCMAHHSNWTSICYENKLIYE